MPVQGPTYFDVEEIILSIILVLSIITVCRQERKSVQRRFHSYLERNDNIQQ